MEHAVDTQPSANEHLLMREFTHRVTNEYTAALNMLSLAATRSRSSEVKEVLEAVSDRLGAYVRVHRALQMPEHNGPTDVSRYLHDLCLSISRSKLARRNISLVFSEHPLGLDTERSWLLGMAVHELINNSARHAFTNAGGEIHVELNAVRDFAECRVTDNGTLNPASKQGRGLEIVEELVHHLGGYFEQEVRLNGSSSIVIFPRKR